MRDTIWDHIAKWLSEYTALQQLGIMLAGAVWVAVMIIWVTR